MGKSIMKGLVPWPASREDIKISKLSNAKQKQRSTEAREDGIGEGGEKRRRERGPKSARKGNVGLNEQKRRGTDYVINYLTNACTHTLTCIQTHLLLYRCGCQETSKVSGLA